MENGSVTTPFGRRPMTLGMLANQIAAQQIAPEKSVDKWKLFRALCEARVQIGISDRALSVLDALLSFYPAAQLNEAQGLVVFPSNAQLSVRAHGMAPATLRRHLADLVQAGLILRKDSPNGKRYARKDRDGDIEQAFGLSLAPLLARAEEIEAVAGQVRAEQQLLRVTKERITLCRRDIAKLIETAMAEAAPGNWEQVFLQFRSIITGIARNATRGQLEAALEELEMLREEIINILEMLVNSQKTSANESHTERHIQNSNPQTITELEPLSETRVGQSRDNKRPDVIPELKSFPLGLVLQACPEIAMYGQGGAIATWRDLMTAAVVVRSTLGISPSAYQEACEVLGPENAATVVACMLERAGHINSAGGYLRTLTDRARKGEFSLGPMVMALLRTNGGHLKSVG
ncbi:replication initiation protein RepC [Rhizobium sp. KVB221]|uniref:Replication initiation protein RepC n=1 Tax=Rhizobium setariae TaxID=2801340 RepID=A0A936YRZ2_9HYPH|nr:plasmid replication protein RepC [Rhizobium setariae]MBL0373682.1 replication initiation protein RepC [Rhizobium setariae]